jgi:cyclophilin family peptidyl-prolyl cis-trans isomerase
MAPKHITQFMPFVNEGVYDDLSFTPVNHGFVAQAGDLSATKPSFHKGQLQAKSPYQSRLGI